MKKITPQGVYDRLLNSDKLLEPIGQLQIFLGDVEIVVRQRDVVCNIIMREWLEGWLKKNGYAYTQNLGTQMPPDFCLDPDDIEENLLEVRTFNVADIPCFDIADFRTYQEELIEKPYLLHVKYLLFGYEITDDGFIVIRQVWLKNAWEIIRPAEWFGECTKYPLFECLEDFVSAIHESVYRNPKTIDSFGTWSTLFSRSYKSKYGRGFRVPRWDDIEDKYVKRKLNT